MPSTSAFQTKVINLSPLEFTRLQNPPFLIDVRSQLEYARGHVPQAKNLSLPRILMGKIGGLKPLVLPQWFRDLPKEQPIAVICLTAHRSPIAAEFLRKEGFTQVFNITGGMREWQKLQLKIVTGKS